MNPLSTPQAILDWQTKGFWVPGAPIADDDFVRQGHDLFDGSFTWPVMALRQDALEHNVETMSAFVNRHRFDFAPHAKTTMSPQIFQMQLAHGAWGVAVATANQALACLHMGVRNVLLANQVLDANALADLAVFVDGTDLRFISYVDSAEGILVAQEAALKANAVVEIVLELGHSGGRTGSRSRSTLLALAQRVASADELSLVGLAAYEGGLPNAEAVVHYLQEVRATYLHLAHEGLLPGPGILTIGGSQWYDLVAAELADGWEPEIRPNIILRAGAYVTHDDGFYRRRTPFTRVPEQGYLVPAIEVWAQVISVPEVGLAIIGMGKRDVPYDEGLPVPKYVRLPGSDEILPFTAGKITRTNDQHAYLELDQGVELPIGSLVCFGISHPCTAFDKWLALPLLAADRKVVGVVRTYL